jgi:serine/threonine protein phosphatase PrpC
MGLTYPEYRRMQTTLSTLSLVGDQAYIGHVGDTRIYRIRDNAIQQLTGDHSEVGELVRMALISAEEARRHPRRNIITRSVGSELLLKPDFRAEPLAVGDIFVLCSDGLWEPVDDREMADAVMHYPADEACQYLVDLALAREASDNISIQTVKVLALGAQLPDAGGRKNGLLQRAFRFLGNQEQTNA